ncbi:MAG TPA: methyltransferase domain-containing protein [Pyrinomonadaceae bacterium]|jgi:SAM-dependent methyltransferase|nr:methyltransferase domain-containing protein [Pyrinomonadaceae bacterium]
MNTALPQEMEQHTYAIMDEVEGSHWWFVGRRAILETFLREIVKRFESRPRAASGEGPAKAGTHNSLRILDVGCGTGANLEMLSQFGQAEGVDVSDDALAFCERKGLKVQKGLAEKLPFADETFDLTTALDVVEHLDDDVAGLKEMYRVTKKGCYSLVFVPAFMWLWGVQDDISNHRIRYTKRQIVERLQKAGYQIERATYANWTFFAPILAGRTVMKLTGIKPESENNVNVSALNGVFGKLFSSERLWLKNFDFPFGVSIVLVARKP